MGYDHGAFRISDLDAAIAFYTNKLGFDFLFRNDNPEFNEVYAFMESNGAQLELIQTTKDTYHPVRPERPYCPHLCFETSDVDGMAARLRKDGIEILDGPNEIPGHEKWFYFCDPDMNVLEYIQWINK